MRWTPEHKRRRLASARADDHTDTQARCSHAAEPKSTCVHARHNGENDDPAKETREHWRDEIARKRCTDHMRRDGRAGATQGPAEASGGCDWRSPPPG